VKVLVAHNRYRSGSPSGEDHAVDDDIRTLRSNGVQTALFLRSSDDVDLRSPRSAVRAALGPVVSMPAVREFDRMLARHRPDLVHLHNVFPLISPWIVRRARRRDVPVVMTVHNFRLDCVNGLYFRDGGVCTDCAGTRLGLPAVRHGCYRGSRLQTVPMAVGRAVHRGTWRLVARYLVGSEAHARFLAGLGVPAARIVLRPNSTPDPGPPVPPGEDVVFVGRLEEGKGVRTLIEGWRLRGGDGRRLKIVGAGPLADEVRAAAARTPTIDFLGSRDAEGVAAALRAAGVLAFPSHYLEPLPRVVVEALAHGRPALVRADPSLPAGLDESVGWRVGPAPRDWAAALDALTPAAIADRGRAARAYYTAHLSAEHSLQTLLGAYDEAMRAAR
jgi:glycosyltransferase involved in cell wall biosynthesis